MTLNNIFLKNFNSFLNYINNFFFFTDKRSKTFNKMFFNQIILGFSIFLFLFANIFAIFFDESRITLQNIYFFGNFFDGLFSKISFGIDGLSLSLFLLTTFLTPLCLIFSWITVRKFSELFMFLFLVIEVMTLIVFSTSDIIFFFVFFEGVLIPMFLIIIIWGSRNRKIRAGFLFFIYTMMGSITMFIGLFLLLNIFKHYLSQYSVLFNFGIFCVPQEVQYLIWFCFFISFSIKMPLLPFHVWLPEAHVEAPTAGSVFLAGVLLKLGTYGFLRYCVFIFPETTTFFLPLIFVLGTISLIYTSLTAIRQTDIKRIIAYTSVAHMSAVLMGMCCVNEPFGIVGSIFQMFSHGLVSGGLFFCIGVIYDRVHSRSINHFGGLTRTMPLFAIVFAFLLLANAGLPLTSNFIGEFLLCLAVTLQSPFVGFMMLFSVIFSAIYCLWLLNQIIFMNIKTQYTSYKNLYDLTSIEIFVFVPIIIGVIFLGLFPFYTYAFRCSIEVSSLVSFLFYNKLNFFNI